MAPAPSPTLPDLGRPLVYRYAYATDRGMVREQNEDTVAIAEEWGLALVADGMGGYNAGEVASRIAAEFLVTHLVDDLRHLRKGWSNDASDNASIRVLHALLRARIDGVNEAIIDAARREPDCDGMGTTLAMMLFADGGVTTLHLGDSRIYRLRHDVLSLLTRDHSLLQEQIDAGFLTESEARDSINRNFVTRALGVDIVAEPEINDYDVEAGDLYLICSDGLPDMLSDEQIFDLLQVDAADADRGGNGPESDGDDRAAIVDRVVLDGVASRLIGAANAQGGRDNVSVVLASVGRALRDEPER